MRQEGCKEVLEHSGWRIHFNVALSHLSDSAILLGCLLLTLLLWLFPLYVFAADSFCGVDTDQSGTASNPCPEPDKDHDGYPSSSAYTGPYGTDVDCDDSDYFMHTGVSTTSGCGAGEYKTCQSTGSYSACATTSAFTCHTGSGKTIWYDNAGVTTAGCGTAYASPCSWLCFSDSSLACYDALDAGDCAVFQAGSYSGSWSDAGTTRQIFVDNRDGTLSNPIILREEPGTRPVFNGAGTSPTEVILMKFQDSNYIQIRGLTLDGTSDYSGSGIWFLAGTAPEMWNLYIHHIDGESDFNMAAIKCSGGTIGCYIHHNLLVDNYETANPTQANSGGITIMDDTGTVKIDDNTIVNSTAVGHGAWIKHGNDTCTPYFRRNFVKNVERAGIGSENKATTVTNNWISDCTGYALEYGGIGSNIGWFKDSVFNYNTIQKCGLIGGEASWVLSTTHQNYSSTTIQTVDHNIVSDDNASYASDAGNGMARFCEYNCDIGERAAASGKVIFTNNIYYNPNDTSLQFGYFGQEGGGADYASFAAWQAAGFDSGSEQADPSLDSDGISGTYASHGYSVNVFTATGGGGGGGSTSSAHPVWLQ